MKAKEAAEAVAKDKLNLSREQVCAMMPEYPNGLHQRQWIAGFLKALPPELEVVYRTVLIPPKKS